MKAKPSRERRLIESSGFAWPAWIGLTFWVWGIGHVMWGWSVPSFLGSLGTIIWFLCGGIALFYFGACIEYWIRERFEHGR